jgi:hypothetical protein
MRWYVGPCYHTPYTAASLLAVVRRKQEDLQRPAAIYDTAEQNWIGTRLDAPK